MFDSWTEEQREHSRRHADGDYCAECGEPYARTRWNKDYCSQKCQQGSANRRVKGGLRLYNAAMRWRIERPKDALVEMTQIADQLASEERSIRTNRKKRIEQIKTSRAA